MTAALFKKQTEKTRTTTAAVKKERKKEKLFIQKQIEHPFSLGNKNIISDKNAVYEREIVLVLVQIWLPQLVVFFSRKPDVPVALFGSISWRA